MAFSYLSLSLTHTLFIHTEQLTRAGVRVSCSVVVVEK